MRGFFFLVLTLVLLQGCSFRRLKGAQLSAQTPPSFFAMQRFILGPKCMSCHAGPGSPQGVDLSTYEAMMRGPLIVPGDPDESPLYVSLREGRMPKGAPALSPIEMNLVYQWILDGAIKSGEAPPPDPPPQPNFEWISTYVFQRRCIGCHDGKHPKTELDLRTYESLMSFSGDLFNAVEPGDPEFSSIVIALRGGTMPPEGDKLSEETIVAIETWIADGAEKENSP